MADFKCHPMLLVTPEQVKAIRENVGLIDMNNLEEAIERVLEWFAKENHLPDMVLDKRAIENMYISRKCSLEQTKKKFDMLFAMKSLLPDYIAPRDPVGPNIQMAFESCNFTPLPRLAPDNTRVTVFQIRDNNPDKLILADTAKQLNMVFEFRLYNDYVAGDRFIADYGNLTLPIVLKWTPTFVNNVVTFMMEGFGTRIKGIHIVNAPSFIGRVLSLMKVAFKPKVFERITVHDSVEDLCKVLPKEILPKDFGGNEPYVNDLADEWYKEFCKPENRKFLLDSEKWKSDEKKRIGGGINSGEFGVDGTFRKLQVF